MREISFDSTDLSSVLLDFGNLDGDYSKSVLLLNFSLIVYGSDTLIITGGSHAMVNERIKFCIASKGYPPGWVRPEKDLAFKRTKLPDLC